MNCVINCFSFTLKATCYLSDGTKVEIASLTPEEIKKVIDTMGVTKLTLMGPTAYTSKIAELIKKISDVEIYLMGATYE
jgi:hypothetical protein